MILYLASDLIWATKIKGVAEHLGVPCRPVRTPEMLEARLADCEVAAVLLDLEKPEEAMAMIARLRGDGASEQDQKIRVVAFGPHVLVELFQQARDAGADEVLARGVLDRNMPEILLALAGRGGSRA
ncbi:MAG: hypothetical protein EA423_02375 [Phycisphaerales bacterium]|nr:MAG: hypothetical protein EA423_02375 [Phycisphaerales bacterium]